MVAIGTGNGPPDLEAGIRLADKYPAFYATVGIHPHDAAKAGPDDFDRLAGLLSHPKVIARGRNRSRLSLRFFAARCPEIGLHRADGDRRVGEESRSSYTRARLGTTRSRLLEQYWTPHGIGGIMHCFSGGPEEARRALDLGFYLSFGGIVTFPKALDVQAAAEAAPRGSHSDGNRCSLSCTGPEARQTK